MFNSVFQKVEFCILQNNSVNIYEEYFADLEPAPIVDRCHSRTMFVYKDVEEPSVSKHSMFETTTSVMKLGWPDGFSFLDLCDFL